MTRVKHMSRGGWIVVGILIAMMLVPSGIAAVRALGWPDRDPLSMRNQGRPS
jgi:hypothetical protein